MMAGCGTQATQTTQLSPAPGEFGSYTAFGDSITCGFVSTGGTYPPYSIDDTQCHAANGYPYYIGPSLRLTAQDYGIPGDQACDVWVRQIAPQQVSPSDSGKPLYTMVIGTNDALSQGTGRYEDVYRNCHMAALSWLGLPASSKALPASAELTGGWALGSSTTLGGYAQSSSGGTATFSIVSYGSPLYLWHVIDDATAGTGSYSVDGGAAVTFSTKPAVPMATRNGTLRSVGVERIAGVAAGMHQVTVTAVSGTVTVLGVGTASVAVVNMPVVAVGSVPLLNSALSNATYNAEIAQYTVDAAEDAALLAGDGLDVLYAPSQTYLTGAPSLYTDLAHVSPSGAQDLANSLLALIP